MQRSQRVEVEIGIPGLRLAGERPAAFHHRRQAFAFCRHLRKLAVWRIDDERRLSLGRGGIGDAGLQRLAEVAGCDCLSVTIDLLRGCVEPLLIFGIGQERLVRVAWRWRRRAGPAATTAACASLERHAAHE